MERCICHKWGQERVPVYLRYVHSNSIYLKRECTDLPMHIGATFANLQPLPNLGVWHGSECKSSMSCVL